MINSVNGQVKARMEKVNIKVQDLIKQDWYQYLGKEMQKSRAGWSQSISRAGMKKYKSTEGLEMLRSRSMEGKVKIKG